MNGIGAPINRTDAWAKVSGAAHYTAEHRVEGLTYAVLVTSTIPSGRVLRIDDGVMRHMATRRIEGSPVRPVAVAAPSREDAGAASDVEAEEEEE